jgi:hypothetical protein
MIDLSTEETSRLRQQEFPQMLRDVVDTGATQLELCIDADTALILAAALDLYNTITGINN